MYLSELANLASMVLGTVFVVVGFLLSTIFDHWTHAHMHRINGIFLSAGISFMAAGSLDFWRVAEATNAYWTTYTIFAASFLWFLWVAYKVTQEPWFRRTAG